MSETTETPDNTVSPEDFNIDDWLQDAHLPEDSCEIYKRPDVISELTRLKARIAEEEAADTGKTLGGNRKRDELQKRYDELLETFTGSRATVYVRAVPEATLRDLRADHVVSKDDEAGVKTSKTIALGYAIMAKSIVGFGDETGVRHDVSLTPEKIETLEAKIGESQGKVIREAWQRAQGQMPEVTVDFLSLPSGTSKEDTSDY